jgi:hypothetical protein
LNNLQKRPHRSAAGVLNPLVNKKVCPGAVYSRERGAQDSLNFAKNRQRKIFDKTIEKQ